MDWTSLDFSKQVSKDGIMGRIEQQAEITRAEILNMIVSRALYSTRPFLFFGWYPLSAKPVTGLYSQRYGSDTLVRLNFKNGSSRSYFSFTIGLEKEIGKTMPKYYTRLGFCYGGNSASNWFTSICVGGGKLLGKKRQHNAGIDLAYTRCSDVLGNHYFKKAATIMENDFIGSVSFRLRSTQLTLAPNISYEYSAPGYGYLRRTVRFTLGLPLSIPLRSEVIATGINTNGVEATSVTRLKRAPDAELYIDGVRKKNYALSKLTGFSFTLGYVFN